MQMQLGISMKRDQIEAVEKRADNQIIHHAVGYHKWLEAGHEQSVR